MLQQLMTENRFVSLAPDDPDNSDTDPEVTEPRSANKPQDEGSTVSDDTVYYDAQDDTPYFQAGADPPPREEWKVADPINFRDIHGVLRLSHQLDAMFRSAKEIEPRWAWTLNSNCGDGQMLAPARCRVPPRDTPPL